MELNKTGILFSSLVGIKKTQRFGVVQNELSKHVLPPIPFLGFKNTTGVIDSNVNVTGSVWQADAQLNESDQFFPLSFSLDKRNTWYLLPYEPMINISGKNTIVRRNVAKAKPTSGDELGGSIKERWSQGDYEITITGALIGSILTGNMEDCFPKTDFEMLKKILTSAKSIDVKCEPLQLLGINQIVIEDFSFPFTKGENVQAYEIKCYSDFNYKLLLELDD